MGTIGYGCARRCRLLHNGVNFFSASQIMPDGAFGGTGSSQSHSGINGEVVSWIDGELESMLQVEEGERAMLELGAHDAPCWQPQAVAVKTERRFQIIHAERDHSNSWFHGPRPRFSLN